MSDAVRPAVFLDRDGVLNRAIVRDGRPYPPACLGEFELLPGVPEALARLKAEGFALIVVTNQPDVARGTQRRDVVEAMNAEIQQALPLDEIRVCYEDDPNCPDRKPNPGMLVKAAERHRLDLATSFMVGDRWRDIEAGQRAGCRTVFIDYAYDEPRPSSPDFIAPSLAEATEWILFQSTSPARFPCPA